MAQIKSTVSTSVKKQFADLAGKLGTSESKLINRIIVNHLRTTEGPKK